MIPISLNSGTTTSKYILIMAKQSFISHVVNGYSRYDVPESKAFSCTPGILYPIRIDFINARDRVRIAQGVDVRSNPLIVPSFNPYTLRLHRFWVPLQLYHPELRTNASKFDMKNLSLNFLPLRSNTTSPFSKISYPNSLLYWLRSHMGTLRSSSYPDPPTQASLPSSATLFDYVNADPYLAYWDIVRNYYSYSNWGVYSFAWPASWFVHAKSLPTLSDSGVYTEGTFNQFGYVSSARYFTQDYGNIEFLDAFYESQFYPAAINSPNNTFNRSNLLPQILYSSITNPISGEVAADGFPVTRLYPNTSTNIPNAPASQTSTSGSSASSLSLLDIFLVAHPMAVAPSSPDRFSRLLPPIQSDDSISLSNISNIPQLAVASRLQEYRDLLGAGGNRFSDWLETFFASKIDHVDRPKLLFSASITVNSQVIINQSGSPSSNGTTGGSLGQMAGSISFNQKLGRSQSYYFSEPGYMIDLISIRPVYYWSNITPDYYSWHGSDYFNPVYNDIGYQSLSPNRIGWDIVTPNALVSAFKEPCFNEFRSSYDEVLGQLAVRSETPSLYSKWVQQRTFFTLGGSNLDRYKLVSPLFVDLSTVNAPFASDVEDNFFVNISYGVRKKNLINKTFATRLANR